MKEPYDLATIRTLTIGEGRDNSKLFKLRYENGERGWAYRLPNEDNALLQRAVITNLPAADRLCFLDVVEIDRDKHGEIAGKVLWRGFACKTEVTYQGDDAGAQAAYDAIGAACRAEGMETEGMVEGLAMVTHHEGSDVRAILEAAKVSFDEITPLEVIAPDWAASNSPRVQRSGTGGRAGRRGGGVG